MARINNILSIAGTDPSCGAGIQADLKTFAALGTYGTSVITCLIAQNTYGIQAIYPIRTRCFTEQLHSVLNDIQIDSVKIGLVYQATIIRQVSTILETNSIPWIVLDTVMTAKSGDPLLLKNAINIFRKKLLPLASIITPNLPEAAILLGCKPAQNEHQMCLQGRQLLNYGCKAVLIKGGHLISSDSPDWLITSKQEVRFNSPRISTKNTHGTGCTLSAAIAALRPRYDSWVQTIDIAKTWLQKTLLHADKLNVGQGIGPVHHFYEWW